MKAFMFHYVRKFDSNFPFSKHKEIADFKKEIKNLISLGYEFKNVTEAIDSLTKDEDLNKVILLTFDDGLKDHLDAAKILKNLGISKATFYIPIQPYLNNEILHVHKAHLILSKEGEKSLDLLFEACNLLDISITDHNNFEIEKEKYKNAYSRFDANSKIKEFKRLINFYGSIGVRDDLLNQIIIKLGIFKKAEDLRAIAAGVPEDLLIIETDSPYLAPVPHRGRSNEPAYVVHTLEQLASIRGKQVIDMADITRANTRRLFDRMVIS